MTEVTFFRRGDGKCTGFRAVGHTGYAKSGSDIVCAAISALTQSAGEGLKNVVKADVSIKTDEKKGLYEVLLKDGQSKTALDNAQILLDTLEMSLTAIQNDPQYPGTIRITTRERR